VVAYLAQDIGEMNRQFSNFYILIFLIFSFMFSE